VGKLSHVLRRASSLPKRWGWQLKRQHTCIQNKGITRDRFGFTLSYIFSPKCVVPCVSLRSLTSGSSRDMQLGTMT